MREGVMLRAGFGEWELKKETAVPVKDEKRKRKKGGERTAVGVSASWARYVTQ